MDFSYEGEWKGRKTKNSYFFFVRLVEDEEEGEVELHPTGEKERKIII